MSEVGQGPWGDEEQARLWVHRIACGQPSRTEQIDVLCALAGAVDPRRILDLGVGAGLVARRLLRRHPTVHVTGLDASAPMLEAARITLSGFEERAQLVHGRIDAPWPSAVGGGYDLVLSAQSVHHVTDAEKPGVFERAFAALRPGGLFLNADRLAFDARLFPIYRMLWNRERVSGDYAPLDDSFTPEAYRERLEEAGDMPAPLADQLSWLEQAGFEAVTCFWLKGDRAAFGGLRPL